MTLKLILTGVLLAAMPVAAGAQVMLEKAVVAAGGGMTANATQRANITLGQAIAGAAANATMRGQFGFWTFTKTTSSSVAPHAMPAADLAIQVWPNPASNLCQITVTSATARDLDVR